MALTEPDLTPPWRYRDSLEAALAAELSPDLLMEHVRRIAA